MFFFSHIHAHDNENVNIVTVSINGEFPTKWKEEGLQLQFYIEFLQYNPISFGTG